MNHFLERLTRSLILPNGFIIPTISASSPFNQTQLLVPCLCHWGHRLPWGPQTPRASCLDSIATYMGLYSLKAHHSPFKKLVHLKYRILFIFRERGREGEREREKRQCARETLIGCLSHGPQPGTWPAAPRPVP